MNPIMQAAAAFTEHQRRQREAFALTRLRDELLKHKVHAELRDNDSALMVHRPGGVGLPVWVFVGYGGAYYSWQSAEKRHPVSDLQGAAQVLADYVGR
ncbi:hypothetical protein [Streptosporangium pseudovulgare]|uniref:Uncharacterized protein n=1 Tax=Streptosporangium pseudovulgare TaxID=35765 RepID=A0ABQ2R199_9ACTN|nr:hypothetical protein [Streptosporangium pseudovulgare]GGQ04963.1 hypothetical protein GCM10010140_38920 [Streptosporangium pseudovulgare]